METSRLSFYEMSRSSCRLETCDETEALSIMVQNMSQLEWSLAYLKSWLDKKGDPPSRSHFLDGKPVSSYYLSQLFYIVTLNLVQPGQLG